MFGQLAQRLKSVEESGGIGRRDGDFSAGDVEAVAFGRAARQAAVRERGCRPRRLRRKRRGKAVAGAPHPRREVGLVLSFEVGRKRAASRASGRRRRPTPPAAERDNTRRKVAAEFPHAAKTCMRR